MFNQMGRDSPEVRHKRYRQSSFIRPDIVDSVALASTGRYMFRKNEFNPSLLPLREMSEYDHIKRIHPSAVYLLAARVGQRLCREFLTQPHLGDSVQSDPFYHTVFSITDDNFLPIASVSRFDKLSPDCEDVRWHARNGKVHLSCWTANAADKPVWHVYELQMRFADASLSLGFAKSSSQPILVSEHFKPGKNRIMLFHGLDVSFVDSVGPGHMHIIQGPDDEPKSISPKHLNGIAIHLRDRNAYLAVSHVHFDRQKRFYPNTYIHYFILFEDRAPWRILQRSNGWCFPSSENAAMCDTIQFVMSAFLNNNGDILTMSYGVNDCDSFVANISLIHVLNRMMKNVSSQIMSNGTFANKKLYPL